MEKVEITDLVNFNGHSPSTIVLIDCGILIHEYFNALKSLEVLIDGKMEKTGHYFGSVRVSRTLLGRGFTVIFCLDLIPQKKHDLHKGYKAGRPKRKFDIKEVQINMSKMVGSFPGCYVACHKGYEADDIIFSLTKKLNNKLYILSRDTDLLQCVNDRVLMARKITARNIDLVDDEYAIKKFGVPVYKVLWYKLLAGDPSDNIGPVLHLSSHEITNLVSTANSFEDVEMIAFRYGVLHEFKKNCKLIKMEEGPVNIYKSSAEEGKEVAKKFNLKSYYLLLEELTAKVGLSLL